MVPEDINLYNSMTREVELLKPRKAGHVAIYCCGPTVYGPAHIGNFRTFVGQDTLRRVLELSGYKTLHVRNLTDVDDKTIRGAQSEQTTLSAFTSRWTEYLHNDCKKLGLLEPHHEPSAVAHIPQQIALISELEARGLTYRGADGSIFFRISAFPNYGKLSKLSLDSLCSNAGRGVSADEYDKENVADFALWKARKEEDGENFWDSPWGQGRPGWHIECSAMALHYLGTDFDIHGGGEDLLFPHHENEIAQSEGATGCTFARHWFHGAHLMVDAQKMSKSLGNLYTLTDLEQRGYTGAEVRYVLLQGHYRKPLNFTFESLRAARQTLQRLEKVSSRLVELSERDFPSYEELVERCTNNTPSHWLPHDLRLAWDSLKNDLNISAALAGLLPVSKKLEREALSREQAYEWQWFLGILFCALGIRFEGETPAPHEVPDEVQLLAEARAEARRRKDWAEADRLRSQLIDLGWEMRDKGAEWELERTETPEL